MNRRGKPPVFALTTFSLLAVAASVVLAFLAAEVYNIGAPAQVVGPNTTDVLAMDIFLYYKVYLSQTVQSQVFLVGCIGGWAGGICFGLTQLKPVLLGMARRR